MLKSTGVGNFGPKFGKGLIDVSRILILSGRDMGLSYTKEIVSISSAVSAKYMNVTDHGMVTSIATG